MSKTIVDISMSLDGYVAGPDQRLEEPLGTGGEGLHEWAFSALSWRESHGKEGGEANADSDVIAELRGEIGASIMGRNMFSGGFTRDWEGDERANGWWGDEPPFHHPVFVLTHHEREPLALTGTTFEFVTDGIEAALERARAAAGDKAVHVAGGGSAARQYLAAGLVDELQLHVAPVLLGGGVRLLDDLDPEAIGFEIDRVVSSPTVTHLRYRVR